MARTVERAHGRTIHERKKELTQAEERLIALLRDETDVQGFSVTIRRREDGRFFVSQSHEACSPSFASGETFEDAWHAAGRFSRSHISCRTVALTLDNEMLRALDSWILTRPEAELSRDEAARSAVKSWLTSLGLLDSPDYPDSTH